MRDNEIRTSVQREFDWEPRLDTDGIEFKVLDGVITLTGHVSSHPQRHEAERAAGRVRGVKAVVNHLDVRIPDAFKRTDEEIARAASCAILSNPELPVGSVRISVDKGRVKLEGMVGYHFQSASADRSVRYLPGVRDVNNHIAVQPHPKRETVKAEIEAVLSRRANLDAHQIKVDTEGDNVILCGTVQSLVERAEAERAAWSSRGVCHVVNNIIVNPALDLARTA